MKLLAWIRAPFAWEAVRHHDGYTCCLENAVTGQRRCHWDGSVWGHIDYSFMRSGDVSYEPFGREVIGKPMSFDRLGSQAAGPELGSRH
jgi:hypothetical protein